MPYRIPPKGGGYSSRGRVTAPTYRTAPPRPSAQPKKKEKDRGFLGGLVHDITHPGISEIAAILSPITLPSYIASHTRVPGLSHAGRIEQALLTSPQRTIAHPKAATKDLGQMVVGLAESPVAISKSIEKYGFMDTMSLLWHSTKADYQARYGVDWKKEASKHPLFNLADLLMVAGPALKVAEIGSAAGRLGRLGAAAEREAIAARGALVKGGKAADWENLTAREKLRIAREEARHPGTMTKGVADTRHLEVNIAPPGAEPKMIWSDQALATGPLRRTLQYAFDDLAEQFPNMKGFGAKSRIMRAQQRNRVRVIDRVLSSVTDVGALKGLNEVARTRAFWEAQLPPARTAEEATEGLKRLRSYLADEYRSTTPKQGDSVEFHDWLQNMKQAGFGDALLKRLDRAIEYTPTAKYERAMTALRQMTGIGEQIIHDTRMFSPLKNERTRTLDQIKLLERAGSDDKLIQPLRDKVAALEEKLVAQSDRALEMMHERRGLVADAVQMGTPIDAPERAAWEKALKKRGWTDKQVSDALAIADQFAHGSGDPVNFYANRVGVPTNESASAFMARVQQGANPGEALLQDFPEFGETPLIETREPGGWTPASTSAYYSRLQKEVSEGWGSKAQRQSGQVEAQLRKKVSAQEFYNAGLDNFFNQHGKNEMISQDQLQDFLASPLNAYNLIEHHRINTHGADAEWMGTAYGGHPDVGWGDTLVSRSPDMGEYHEITFSLPGAGRDPLYTDTGASHWGSPGFSGNNVVGHVRFHVFEEHGARKLLIEEIQSDWASDYRKAVKRGREYKPMTPERQAEADRLWSAYEGAKREHYEAERKYDQILQVRNETYHDLSEEARVEIDNRVEDARDAYSDTLREADEASARAWAAREGEQGVPPSALSSNQVTRLAVNRVLRHAAEHQVDQVIVVDRHAQHIRNVTGGYGYRHDWEDIARLEPKEARTASLDLMDEETPYARIYEQDIPKQIKAMIEVEGEHVEDAYQGHYATQGGVKGPTGDMSGTLFDLDATARQKALRPTHLYQRQPEWGKLPRGANELLKGGNQRVIHLFQKADISTWIHELAHSAVYDLAPEERLVLENYYGGGAGIEKWDNAAHENFARDMERYFREGQSPHKLLTAVFERIQNWMIDVYRKVKGDEPDAIPPHVEAVFRKMLRPDLETPEIFMPHRALPPDLAGTRMASGIPRRAREVGDRVDLRYPIFKENKLALLRSGLVNDDPRLLVEHVNRLVSVQRANQLREFVLEHATPLDPRELPMVDFDQVYVVKETGTSPHKALFDAIEGAENPEEIRKSIAEFTDAHFVGNETEARQLAQEMQRMGAEAWSGDNRLYTIDKQTVDLLFKNATGRGPGATTRLPANVQRIIDTGLNATRSVLLYGNPGFYVANLAGNFGMMMFNDPRAAKFLASGIRRALTQGKDPVYERVVGEMGRGPTAGGLREPEHILGREALKRPGHALMNAVDRADYTMLRIGHAAGSAVDNPFRYAAWRQEAAKRGYRTDAQVMKLLDDANEDARAMRSGEADSKAIRDLNGIRDKAEQMMLDFDSLSPTERNVLARIIFLYPFLKASAKYPLMYTGEHPFTMGAALQASNIGSDVAEEVLGPRPNLPEWAKGYARTPWGMVNVGSIDQMSVLAGELESLYGLGSPTPVGINRAINFLNPSVQLAIELAQNRNRYGREANWGSIIASDAPLPNYITQLWRQPSAVYDLPPNAGVREREIAALIRSLRLFPYRVNPNWQPGQGGGGG